LDLRGETYQEIEDNCIMSIFTVCAHLVRKPEGKKYLGRLRYRWRIILTWASAQDGRVCTGFV
jgi:hypothetical protein